jgi:hypothetical protein
MVINLSAARHCLPQNVTFHAKPKSPLVHVRVARCLMAWGPAVGRLTETPGFVVVVVVVVVVAGGCLTTHRRILVFLKGRKQRNRSLPPRLVDILLPALCCYGALCLSSETFPQPTSPRESNLRELEEVALEVAEALRVPFVLGTRLEALRSLPSVRVDAREGSS